jgi:hypothetical protein
MTFHVRSKHQPGGGWDEATRPSRSSSATRRAMFLESSKPQWGLASNKRLMSVSITKDKHSNPDYPDSNESQHNITSMIRTIMTTIKTIITMIMVKVMILQTMRLLPKKDVTPTHTTHTISFLGKCQPVSLDPRGHRHSHPQSDRCSLWHWEVWAVCQRLYASLCASSICICLLR